MSIITAVGAREILDSRGNPTVEVEVQLEDGTWRILTNKGDIIAEHVVNAAGLWAREVGRMVGLELPVLAMEHMYLITEDMPEVIEFNKSTGKELMHCVDFDGEIYIRQERNGMLMGTYEKDCRPWSPIETPWTFGHELLAEDLERITNELDIGFRHFPAFNNAGIKKIINGPFTFAPDGNPLVGPVQGLTNFWVACGVMAGFSQAESLAWWQGRLAAAAQGEVRILVALDDDGVAGTVSLPRSMLAAQGERPLMRRPPPTLGQHTAEVLAELKDAPAAKAAPA